MTQYISKSALVAEIEKLKEENKPNSKSISEYIQGGIYGFDLAIEKTLGILDTLEVKGVNFDAEWEKYFEYKGEVATVNVKHLAKHFFELGMQVSNKAQKGE